MDLVSRDSPDNPHQEGQSTEEDQRHVSKQTLQTVELITEKIILELTKKHFKESIFKVLTCNPSTLGGQGRWITEGQVFKTSLAKNPISTKNTKFS